MKLRHAALFFVLLLTGCALTPKAEINYRDRKFTLGAITNLGIIKADSYTIKPMDTSQAVAMQFGLVGALVGALVEPLIRGGIESAKNSFDDSIDEEGVVLYRKSFELIKERLFATPEVHFKKTASPEIDAVALSKQIRDLRLWGGSVPTNDEIANFTGHRGMDYVLYNKTWSGIYRNSNQLFVASDWRIYDANGREAVFIFTRSVVENPSSSSLPSFLYTDKFLDLFGQNVDKFLGTVNSLTPVEIGMKV